MRRVGLPDLLGSVCSLVAVAWLPGSADPLTHIKLLFLIGGGLVLAPAVVQRWRAKGRPSGLAIAAAREPLPVAASEQSEASKTPKANAADVSRAPAKLDGPSTPVWVSVAGGVLGRLAEILVGAQTRQTNQVESINSQEAALEFIANPFTPCVLRVQVTQQVIQQLPAEVSVPAALRETDLDRRCPPMINFASDVLTQQQLWEEADSYAADGVTFDPLLDLAWVLRGKYYLGVGDIAAAEAAAEEAKRVQELYPEGVVESALVETLLNDVELAKEQAG